MLPYIVFAICIALCRSAPCTPHGVQISTLVSQGFNDMDLDKDGTLSTAELNYVWLKQDINGDGNLTLAEYAAAWNTSPDILAPIFNIWDKDGDGDVRAIDLMNYNLYIDNNRDNQITYAEYDKYMSTFFECVYCHQVGVHIPNCFK